MLGPPAEGHWGLCDFQQSRPTEGLSTAAAGSHSIRTSLQWGDSAPCPTAGCFGRVVLLLWMGCFLCVRPAAGRCCSLILMCFSAGFGNCHR